jgi:hypothetical protein
MPKYGVFHLKLPNETVNSTNFYAVENKGRHKKQTVEGINETNQRNADYVDIRQLFLL